MQTVYDLTAAILALSDEMDRAGNRDNVVFDRGVMTLAGNSGLSRDALRDAFDMTDGILKAQGRARHVMGLAVLPWMQDGTIKREPEHQLFFIGGIR